jgi:hypothetical protein
VDEVMLAISNRRECNYAFREENVCPWFVRCGLNCHAYDARWQIRGDALLLVGPNCRLR